MKKVLILAYDFPPYNSIGAHRPAGWFRYLKLYGVEPIVVTRQWKPSKENPYISGGYTNKVDLQQKNEGQIIYAPYKQNLRDRLLAKKSFIFILIAKVISLIQIILEFFFTFADPKKSIYYAANNYLKHNKADMIIATGEPFILFKYANKLSKSYNIPWIADYRDGWSTNYSRPKWMKLFYTPIEKQIVKNSNRITTASIAFKNQLQKLFPAKSINVIYNGYFEELLQNLPEQQKDDVLKIGFSGTLYPYQPIENMIKSLFEGVEKQGVKSFSFLFVGLQNQAIQMKRLLENLPGKILEKCIFTKKLSQKEAIKRLNECHILLLPANPKFPQLYAKVFEYMALQKAILYYKKDKSDLSHILGSYKLCFSADNEDELKKASGSAIKHYQNRNQLSTLQKQKYTRRESTNILADIIKEQN